MNRWLLTGLLLALAASLSLYGVAKGERDAPADSVRQVATPVKVLTLRKSTADEVPGFPGRVEAGDSALLAFRVGGQLRDLKVRMGNQVEQGAVLAELDPTDYQLNVDARQAEFDLAQLEADRASTLFTQKLISEDQYDTAQTVLATSRAKLQQAREQLSFCKLTACLYLRHALGGCGATAAYIDPAGYLDAGHSLQSSTALPATAGRRGQGGLYRDL
jgi:multidrug efflux pump subunit AcrA (membrane-fusion protein)